MKNFLKWTRSGGAIVPAFLLAATLAAFVVLAAAPAARAQGPAPEAPMFADAAGGDFEFADDDGADGCDGCRMRGMHGGRGRMGAGMGMHRAEAMEKLKLTSQQKAKMADLREAQQRKMIGIRSGLAEAQLDMRKLMRADTPSQAQVDATIDRMARLRADAQKSRVATRIAMRGLLTDSQRKTLDEMKGGMRRMGGGRHGA